MSRLETIISRKNTTNVPLLANTTFTGQPEELSSFQEITINIMGLPNTGAPATFYFEFSPNEIDWDISVPLLLTHPQLTPLTLRVILPYFRVRYLNGGTNLISFRLTTILHRASAKQITRFLFQPLAGDEPIENVRSVIGGFNGDGYSGNVPLGDGYELLVGLFDQGTISKPLRIDPTGTTIQPITYEPLSIASTGQSDVTSVPVLIANPSLTNRKSIRVKSFVNNSAVVYIGFSADVSSTTGDELAAGEAIDIEIDDTVSVYMVAASGTQRVSWTEVA